MSPKVLSQCGFKSSLCSEIRTRPDPVSKKYSSESDEFFGVGLVVLKILAKNLIRPNLLVCNAERVACESFLVITFFKP